MQHSLIYKRQATLSGHIKMMVANRVSEMLKIHSILTQLINLRRLNCFSQWSFRTYVELWCKVQ